MDQGHPQNEVEIRFTQQLMTGLGCGGAGGKGNDFMAPHTRMVIFHLSEALLLGVTDTSLWRKEGVSDCNVLSRETS